MKTLKLKAGILALGIGMLFVGCSDNDGPQPHPNGDQESKYVLITMSSNVLEKPGYATAFDEMPSGNIANNGSNALQGFGFGGWRPYGNWLFKMFSTETNALGIERLDVNANGDVTPGQFIAGDNTNGTGNFVIVDETKGYYWDGASPMKIQTFNPTTLSRTGEIDLEDAVNERGVGEAGIKYRSIGQKFLAVKGGKLFANITYATGAVVPQTGFWDDYYDGVYIAVIDIATGAHEKTIEIEDTGSIAYINDNNMYDFDTNGDLYIVTQGRSATGGKSKIVRIKANETDIDPEWSLNMDDITDEGPRKFVSVFAKDGKIITLIPNAPLTGGPNGNINFSDVWEYFSIDIASGERTKIGGIPAVTNPGAAFCAIEIDDKILLRVNTEDGSSNGYFEYNASTNSATELFKVTSGGSVSGLHKVNVGN